MARGETGAMARSGERRLETVSLTGVQWVTVTLALLMGLIHLYVGVSRGRPSLVIAGVGFGAGVALFLADYRRHTLYLSGIGYTVLQIVLWMVFQQGEYNPIGFVDKTIQALLIVTLLFLVRTDT